MTIHEKAVKLGMSPERLQAEMMAFLQSEGYDDYDYGCEYATLEDWLRRDHRDPKPDRTPWQKSDDYDN